jgi:hypothetical protein
MRKLSGFLTAHIQHNNDFYVYMVLAVHFKIALFLALLLQREI